MHPHAEARGHPRAVQRRAQQEAADVLAVFVEVLGVRGARRLEAVEAGGLPLGADLGIEQVAGLDGAAGIGHFAVEHHAELVVRMDVAAEVQLVREKLDHLAGQLRRRARRDGRGVERAFHAALGDRGLLPGGLFGLAQVQGAVEGARQADGGGRSGAQLQSDQPRGPAAVQRPRHGSLEGQPGLDVHRVVGVAERPHREFGFGRRQAQAQQRLFQRLTRQHLHGHVLEALDAGLGLGNGSLDRGQGRGCRRVEAGVPGILDRQLPAERERGETRRADQKARRVPDRWMSRIELLHRLPATGRDMGGRPAMIQFRLPLIRHSQIRA